MEKKTKSIQNIENLMGNVDESSIRYKVLNNAKHFKTSWIDLGQTLYTVWKDKLYKEWGYQTFDAYSAKEIGIRKDTALKLLRSYYFLENEEPRYLNKEAAEEVGVSKVPSYEAVDLLRTASSKKALPREDYEKIKSKVLNEGRDVKEVKKDLTVIMKQQEELDPKEVWQKKRLALIKRMIGVLRSIKDEIKTAKILPMSLVKELEGVISKLEKEAPSK